MTRADMADYFQRLKTAQAAANVPLLRLSLLKLWMMMMIMIMLQKKVLLLLLFLKVNMLLLENLNLKDLGKELIDATQ